MSSLSLCSASLVTVRRRTASSPSTREAVVPRTALTPVRSALLSRSACASSTRFTRSQVQTRATAAGAAAAVAPTSLPPVPATLPPGKVFEAAVNTSVLKASYSWQKVAMLSFLAGCQIALGALLMVTVGGGSPSLSAANPGLGKWLGGAIGLPVGLSMVILTGGELFTGNVFFMLAGWLSNKVSARALAVNWGVSFLGNFAGSLFVAALAFMAGTTAAQPWLNTTLSVAAMKSSLPFATAFTRGMLCNWMVCTAVWMATASQSPAGKFLGIWLCVSSFVAMGFEHSIANMFLIPLGILNGAAVSWPAFLSNNLLPVTLGNIVGGGLLIAGCYFFAYGERAVGTPAN